MRTRVQISPHEHRWLDLPGETPAPRAALAPCAKCPPGKTHIKPVAEIVPGLRDPLPDVGRMKPDDPRATERHVSAFRWLLRQDIPPPRKAEGAGLVVCGGGKYWPGVVVCVRMLRDVSDLPVQVWHRTAEAVEPADLAGVPGVTFHVADECPHRVLRTWEVKTLALVNCGWEKLLFLDADAYFVADPSPLLALATEAEPFVYWGDLHSQDRRVKWPAFGLDAATGQAVPPVQGGHFALHRRAWWRELALAHWWNQHSDYAYRHGFGDQDTFRVVLAATGKPYRYLGRCDWRHPAYVCSLEGTPLVVHRARGKWDISRAPHLPDEGRALGHLARMVSG